MCIFTGLLCARQRQCNCQTGPLPWLAFDPDLATQAVNILPALVGTDSHSGITLGGIKGPEQTITYKCRVHAAACILDQDPDTIIPAGQGKRNLTIVVRRILGIVYQVLDHGSHTVAIHDNLYLLHIAVKNRYGPAARTVAHSSAYHGDQIDTDLPASGDTCAHQLHQPLHLCHRMIHNLDNIIDKFGFMFMLRSRADKHGLLGNQVLDIVQHESRQTMKPLELASLGSKVLHPRSVEFAGRYKVPLRVLSTFGDGPGTLITL